MMKFRQHTTTYYLLPKLCLLFCTTKSICSSDCEIYLFFSQCMLEEISLLTFPAPSKPRLIKMPFNSFLGAVAN